MLLIVVELTVVELMLEVVDVRDVVLSAHRATHRAVAQGRTADRVGKGAARGAQSTHGASGGVGGARQGYASETRKVSSGLQR